jgi:hypothetical protein
MKKRIFLLITLGLILAAAASITSTTLIRQAAKPRNLNMTENAIQVIMPYKYAGTWVFDDERTGLLREPFVAGIPEMMDELTKDIPNAQTGFRLTFSAAPFPDFDTKLVWKKLDRNGNWYFSELTQAEGWLCPALLKYYSQAPEEIYIKAESAQ